MLRLARHPGYPPVHSVTCTDEDAIRACLHLADHQRVLVEPACGASLSFALIDNLLTHPVEKYTDIYGGSDANTEVGSEADEPGSLVVIVCGGNMVSSSHIQEWQTQLNTSF